MASANPPNPTSNASLSDSTTTSNTTQSAHKTFSCVLCAKRKVRCDKRPGSCSNCTKANVKCLYEAPPPPRRRRKGAREIDINAKLRLYENALRKLGVDPATLEAEELLQPGKGTSNLPSSDLGFLGKEEERTGMLVANDEGNKSIYLENNLWTRLKVEFRDNNEMLEESSDEEQVAESKMPSPPISGLDVGNLLFDSPRSTTSLRYLHPQSTHIFQLWNIYIENVNPFVKVLHIPTARSLVTEAAANLDDLPRSTEALMFCMYCAALLSLDDDDCRSLFGESRSALAQRYRGGAQQALINASFLKTSDFRVVQAFVLFILFLYQYDARVTWILTGVIGRIGQRIGIHRDGERDGLPPFECEMRRRVWWQILLMEGVAEKLAGTSSNLLAGDAKMPLNINDCDLYPGMKEYPPEHHGATEMMFFLIRCHVGQFLRRTRPQPGFDGFWNKLSKSTVDLATKMKAIDELEEDFNRKFVQYCDESVTWHLMCSYLCQAIIKMMRFIALGSDEQVCPPKMTPEEKDLAFRNSLDIVKFQNVVYHMKHMRGYRWHVNLHYQWKSMIYLLTELCSRPPSADVELGWNEVRVLYENHPFFSKELCKRALPLAIGNLTLKAWDASIQNGRIPPGGEPLFIRNLRAQHSKRDHSEDLPQSSQVPPNVYPEGPWFGGNTLTPSVVVPQDNVLQDGPLWGQWNADMQASLGTATQDPDLQFPLTANELDQFEDWQNWENIINQTAMDSGYAGYLPNNASYNYHFQ